jgi:hypothetical protein
MSCCGQNRQAWRQWNAPKAQLAPPEPVLQNTVTLHYLGTSSLVIKGTVTNHTYLFASEDTGLSVDERDAPALIATGRFVQAPSAKAIPPRRRQREIISGSVPGARLFRSRV